MDEERKIIARACEARVLGVWALHQYDDETYVITHVPSGAHVPRRLSHAAAERAWRALAEQLPRFAEDAAFGTIPSKVNFKSVAQIVDGSVRGLRKKSEPAEPKQ